VTKFEDFGRAGHPRCRRRADPEAGPVFVTLANGYTFAARGSGTEPKMKFYLFASDKVGSAAELPAVKAQTCGPSSTA
jgi:phosphoglucomutase